MRQYLELDQIGFHQPARRDGGGNLGALSRRPPVILFRGVPRADETERAHAPGAPVIVGVTGGIGMGDRKDQRAVAVPRDEEHDPIRTARKNAGQRVVGAGNPVAGPDTGPNGCLHERPVIPRRADRGCQDTRRCLSTPPDLAACRREAFGSITFHGGKQRLVVAREATGQVRDAVDKRVGDSAGFFQSVAVDRLPPTHSPVSRHRLQQPRAGRRAAVERRVLVERLDAPVLNQRLQLPPVRDPVLQQLAEGGQVVDQVPEMCPGGLRTKITRRHAQTATILQPGAVVRFRNVRGRRR